MTRLQLIGGWGYRNLGDEALLHSYLLSLPNHEVVIASANPARTQLAQGGDHRLDVRPEQFKGVRALINTVDTTLLCGGGYLNGWWGRAATRKLLFAAAATEHAGGAAHAVEVRHLVFPWQRTPARRLFQGLGSTTVRDHQSKNSLRALGCNAGVSPDAISLLQPHLDRFAADPRARNRVLLHLPRLDRRPDISESGFDAEDWPAFVDLLVTTMGDAALGLATPALPEAWWRKHYPSVETVSVDTVASFVGVIMASDGVISGPMHPALLASLFGRRSIVFPYNGKILPTYRAIGLNGELIAETLDVKRVLAQFEGQRPEISASVWRTAYLTSMRALMLAVGT